MTVTALNISEDVIIHPSSLKLLQKNLGLDGSQDVVERAVYEMSERLGRIELALRHQDVPAIGKIAKSLIGISNQTGLLLFSKVAKDVTQCIDQANRPAIFAVTARLLRIGEASLFAAAENVEAPN